MYFVSFVVKLTNIVKTLSISTAKHNYSLQ